MEKKTKHTLDGKRLMILGAGAFQMPAVRKAVSLGCYVITVDYLPNNIGHCYSHESVNCSTTDFEGVLKAAQDHAIDGICTFSSDIAIPTVAFVNESLGLFGPSISTAEIMTKKHRFRSFLKENSFSCPKYVSSDTFEFISDQLNCFKFPIIFKPVDTSGSRGIVRVDSFDMATLKRAFEVSQSFSPSNTVCIEEFVEGTEVGGDVIVVDGKVAFIGITHKHLQGFVVTGHSLPANISIPDQVRVIKTIEDTCVKLNYKNGPLNFDAIVSTDSVTILEMSPRNGGNGIAGVIQKATSVDVEEAALFMALGQRPILPNDSSIIRGAGSFVFGSTKKGLLVDIADALSLMDRVPELFDVQYVKSLGDTVEPLVHNGNLIGYVLFESKDSNDYRRIVDKTYEYLKITVKPQVL